MFLGTSTEKHLSRSIELLLLSLIPTRHTQYRKGLLAVNYLASMALRHNNEARVPVIDISKHDPQVADEMIAAVVKWGFVYVHGYTGFTPVEIDSMFGIVRLSC